MWWHLPARLARASALASLLSIPAQAQTTLRVQVPSTTPLSQPLYVAGSFNGWQPAAAGYALIRQPDGTYQLTLPAGLQGPQEFKLTRGSWATVEAGAQFQPVPNRQAVFASSPAALDLCVAAWQDQRPGGTAPAAPHPHTLTANVRVLADSFRLPQLAGRTRRVWLYLPPSYARQPARRYPVLYLQDGQNVFDEATAFASEWGVDETLNQLAASSPATEAIVVAVDNGDERRLDEYSP